MATPNLKVDKSQRIDAKRNGWRTVGLTAILGIGLIVFVFPFYWLLVASTRKSTDVFSKTPHMIPGTELFNNIRNLRDRRRRDLFPGRVRVRPIPLPRP